MPLLRRIFMVAGAFGLLFLVPSAGPAAYQPTVYKTPDKIPLEIFRGDHHDGLRGQADSRLMAQFKEPGKKVLLAKTPTPRKTS